MDAYWHLRDRMKVNEKVRISKTKYINLGNTHWFCYYCSLYIVYIYTSIYIRVYIYNIKNMRLSRFELVFTHCESGALFTEPLPRGTLTSYSAQYIQSVKFKTPDLN